MNQVRDWQTPMTDSEWDSLREKADELKHRTDNLRRWYKDPDVMGLSWDFAARHAIAIREQCRGESYYDVIYGYASMLYHRATGWEKQDTKLVGKPFRHEDEIVVEMQPVRQLIWDMWRE